MTKWQTMIKALTDNGINQSEIARECGCTRAAISAIALGHRKFPSYELGNGIVQLFQREGLEGEKKGGDE